VKIYWYRNSKNLIGHRLHDLRISQHLTQRQLAARMQLAGMEMNEVTILRIEKGVRFVPDYEVARPGAFHVHIYHVSARRSVTRSATTAM